MLRIYGMYLIQIRFESILFYQYWMVKLYVEKESHLLYWESAIQQFHTASYTLMTNIHFTYWYQT